MRVGRDATSDAVWCTTLELQRQPATHPTTDPTIRPHTCDSASGMANALACRPERKRVGACDDACFAHEAVTNGHEVRFRVPGASRSAPRSVPDIPWTTLKLVPC